MLQKSLSPAGEGSSRWFGLPSPHGTAKKKRKPDVSGIRARARRCWKAEEQEQRTRDRATPKIDKAMAGGGGQVSKLENRQYEQQRKQ